MMVVVCDMGLVMQASQVMLGNPVGIAVMVMYVSSSFLMLTLPTLSCILERDGGENSFGTC